MPAINVSHETFDEEVINSDLPVLVDFWAPWCGPCRMMAPTLEELSNDMKDTVKVAKLNTEEPGNDALAYQYRIMSIPNMKLFKDGKVIAEFIGLRPKDMLRKELEEHLNKA
jgi:thioredoxin 1